MKCSTRMSPRTIGWLEISLLIFLLVVPFFITVLKSFFALDTALPEIYNKFVGSTNYKNLIINEPEFKTSLIATTKFLGITILQFPIALLLAVWFRFLWPSRLSPFLVILLIFPMLLSSTLLALIGRFYLHDQVGLISRGLKEIGLLAERGAPLGTSDGAWLWISIFDAWQWVPFTALVFWLCFRLVPERQIEASRLDNLNLFTRLRYINLPYVVTPMAIIVLFRMLEAFRAFDLVYVLTGGGPGTSTMMTSIYANRITFLQQRFGIGAAHLVLLYLGAFVLIIVLIGRLKILRGLLRE